MVGLGGADEMYSIFYSYLSVFFTDDQQYGAAYTVLPGRRHLPVSI
jgi:hypothetical protein